MRRLQPTTILLMTLLIGAIVGCARAKHQVDSYEGCMSLCSDELKRCLSSCYAWKHSDKKAMRCVQECNQKSAECQKLCSKLKGPTSPPMPEYYNQGGDAG